MYTQTVPQEYIAHVHPLPSIIDQTGTNNLEGNIGKFFSRAFDPKGFVKKLPRILIGGTTALLTAGTGGTILKGVLTGAAGGIAAAIPGRKAGSSLLTDVGVGVGMGTAVGAPIGIYRGLTSPETRSIYEIGLAGKATQSIQQQWFPQAYQRLNPQLAQQPMTGPEAEALLQSSLNQGSGITEQGEKIVKESGGFLSTATGVLKASTPLLLAVMAGGGAGSQYGEGQYGVDPYGTGQATYSNQLLPQYVDEGVPVMYTGGGGGGGGGLIPIMDPVTGKVRYVQPTFWQKYKTYIIIGSAVVLGGAAYYKYGRG